MLRSDPRAPLTMARAAEAVGATPMSLYRYFEDRDDLVVSVTRHVLRDADVGLPEEAPWQDRLRAWMTTVHRRALLHPQLFQMAAAGESPAWLTCSARLAEILSGAGLADEREVAAAVYLVGTTTLGQAMVAAASGHRLSRGFLRESEAHLTRDEVERVRALAPHLVDLADGGFAIVVEATVLAIASGEWASAVGAEAGP